MLLYWTRLRMRRRRRLQGFYLEALKLPVAHLMTFPVEAVVLALVVVLLVALVLVLAASLAPGDLRVVPVLAVAALVEAAPEVVFLALALAPGGLLVVAALVEAAPEVVVLGLGLALALEVLPVEAALVEAALEVVVLGLAPALAAAPLDLVDLVDLVAAVLEEEEVVLAAAQVAPPLAAQPRFVYWQALCVPPALRLRPPQLSRLR